MPSASAPFKNKTPFHSRVLGLDYQAFGLDFVNPPYADFTAGMDVTPVTQFSLSGGCNVPFTPSESKVYTITNPGKRGISWTAASSVPWIAFDVPSGILAGLNTVLVTATISPDSLAPSLTPYVGTITFTNLTNGVGNVTTIVSLTKVWPGYNDDSFDTYPLGGITTVNQGHCWGADGYFIPIIGIYSFDSFDDYAAGSISSIDLGVGWRLNGTLDGPFNYTRTYDDFDSYPVGAITLLTYTDASTSWTASGFFTGPNP